MSEFQKCGEMWGIGPGPYKRLALQQKCSQMCRNVRLANMHVKQISHAVLVLYKVDCKWRLVGLDGGKVSPLAS